MSDPLEKYVKFPVLVYIHTYTCSYNFKSKIDFRYLKLLRKKLDKDEEELCIQ